MSTDLPWKPTPCPGIEMKVLLEDKDTGLLTALFRWQPGSELTLHEHVEVEQTFVLEGSLVDDEGEVTAGNYVWRPKGNRHIAKSPNGALVLSIFLKPNIFLTGDERGAAAAVARSSSRRRPGPTWRPLVRLNRGYRPAPV